MNWSDSTTWLVFGLVGNAAFFSRFLVQWIASERAGNSVVPVAFWHLSILGTLILLVYAIHRKDPVFTLAYLPNAFVYVRNLALINNHKKKQQDANPSDRDRSLRPESSSNVA
jgi:lipid-A-disaccharide synthase-like uncharacterized protein